MQKQEKPQEVNLDLDTVFVQINQEKISVCMNRYLLHTVFPRLDAWASISRLCVACLASKGAQA